PQGTRLDLASSAAHHLIIDIAHADLLRDALAMLDTQTPPRIWLLLAPEDRRAAADLLADPRIGHLLKPWRRDTLARALAAKPAKLAAQKIWVVEDNPVNARLIRAVLEAQGHDVTIHADGTAFRHSLAQDRPALVLMDVELPGESGLSITRRLRRDEQARGLEPLRILALTSHSAATMEAECLAAGMNGMLRKPLQPDELALFLAAAENRDAA
ncbi:MAG: response regulator, partial [Aestuariivirgaceae bacterium]|nr:response regulator [Aestuariivirgaceae bacterium]